MRKIILSILGILIIVASVYGAMMIVKSKSQTRPRPAKVVKTVFVDTVQNQTVPIVVPANGNLVAKQRVELFSEVQGVFQKGSRLFKTGQPYRKGDVIIRIDASEYYASVQSAKSDLYNQITSVMPDLRLDYPDVYEKWRMYLSNFDLDKNTPTLPDIENDNEQYFISGRGILTTYYNVKNMEQRLAKYTIRAPYSGILTEALVTEGTLIRSGQKLGEFINTNVYELEVAISKSYSDLLNLGEEVELTNLNRTKTYKGKVSRINGKVDQASQTITAFIEVRHEDLKEGMYLEANLNAKEENDAIEVDRGLLLENNQIFVVRDSVLDLLEVNPVFFSDKTVVLKEVPEGTAMVARPVVGAYAGMLVKVYEERESVN